MVKLEEQKRKIDEIEEQIYNSKSWKRRKDLIKYKRRLIRELEEAKRFLGEV